MILWDQLPNFFYEKRNIYMTDKHIYIYIIYTCAHVFLETIKTQAVDCKRTKPSTHLSLTQNS